ncbi:MAG: UDP-glucose/GDP-mannose dehydrogenase family protein [Armatimonadota bacterium]
MKLAIIGTGYVGLVSGACLSEFGHTVMCVDTDEHRISALNAGEIPIYEPGLRELVLNNSTKKRLQFTLDISDAVPSADAVFIAVGTPTSRRGDGYADMSYVYGAAKDIASNLSGYTVIVNKSTVPVGTAKQVARIIKETNPDADFDVVSNPEFLREGAAIDDFMHPDRVVIGRESDRAAEVMMQIYKPLYLLERPFVVTNLETAELIKYSANAFLATKISFINEISSLCEAVGADVTDVARGIGLDGRIGKKFLHAGPGYGGSCFPKDTRALLRIGQEHGAAMRIVETTVEVNEAQKARMVHKIRKALGGSVAGKTIGILGLSFKPETDDMREAPSLTIIPRLIENGARVKVHDPVSMSTAAQLLPGVQFVEDEYSAAEEADALVLLTEWNQYRALDLTKVKNSMNNPVFIDLRNVYEPVQMTAIGFRYFSIGR